MALTADLLRKIKYDNFVVVDLETTGLDPTADRIIEIGAVRYQDGQEKEVFETLVNPDIPIPGRLHPLDLVVSLNPDRCFHQEASRHHPQ